jgi:hypothetical protein
MSYRTAKIGIAIAASGMFLVIRKIGRSYYLGVSNLAAIQTMPETLALDFKVMRYRTGDEYFLANTKELSMGDYSMNSTYGNRKYWYNTKNINIE